MKKTAKILLCLVLVISLSATLIACGGSDDISGRYSISAMEMNGTKVEGELLETTLSMLGLSGSDMFVELNADGTGTMSILGQTQALEYADGQIWPTNNAAAKVPFEVDGNDLTIAVEGYTMTFSK